MVRGVFFIVQISISRPTVSVGPVGPIPAVGYPVEFRPNNPARRRVTSLIG